MKPIFLVALLVLSAAPVMAQDTLQLSALQEAALRRDPRMGQFELHETATELRLRNLSAERLPQFTLRGEAGYQSEVPGIPVDLPGADTPEPPRDRYTAMIEADQLLYDGGVLARRADVERARLAVARAELATALYPLRTEVNDAFFTAVLLQARAAEVATLLEDLSARLAMLRMQVEAGAALPGDTAAVQAELLRAMQNRDEIAADRRTALAVLGELTGQSIAATDLLILPNLTAQVARTRAAAAQEPSPKQAAGVLRSRPEYARFDAELARLDREAALVAARSRPRISMFGQGGYGRPGLDLFSEEFHAYGLAGIRIGWAPWNWGSTGRDEEILAIQRRVVQTEQAAFTNRLRRQLRGDVESMDRLQSSLEIDRRIIALRDQVERQAALQLEERAITAADYLDVRTDLQEARLAHRRHVVELARVQAQYLTTLGIELQSSPRANDR